MFPITDPTLIFLVVLLIILAAPIVMGKLRIPHIVGMVLAGVAVGQYGFNILPRDDSFELFGKVGLYYIMFLAALEMDIEGVRRKWWQVLLFGLLTFAVPFVVSLWAGGAVLGYSLPAALLLGCVMSSHTLIAYPIVSRYGLQGKPSVQLSVGASMIALLLALLTLAALLASCGGHAGWGFWAAFVGKFAVYCALMLLCVPPVARWFLRRYSDAVMQFVFVLAVLFLGAALSQAVGLEGIFGAFFSGLVLNRYIPHVSPLMNRLEFTGNAIFIPYFLIGVGMLINLRLLFQGGGIVWVVAVIALAGTAGKALAAYAAALVCRLPVSSGHMMFGLTSAHAAGSIAMVMVGMRTRLDHGTFLVDDTMLNGIVIMILATCIISTITTQRAAEIITIRDQEVARDTEPEDERMLLPMKYPEYAQRIVSTALLMRNPKARAELVGLNVVYDDEDMRAGQERGERLLEQMSRYAAAADVHMATQVRVAANIANGIKHAFKEYHATEIILGMHTHKEVSNKFWGQFHQSLFNGLSRQITMVRCQQPPATLRHIEVAVPSRAQFEPGFYRWLERLCRMADNLDCRITFHARGDTLALIRTYVQHKHPNERGEYVEMEHWNQLPALAERVAHDHLFVVVTARKGTVSFKSAQERLPEELTRHFSGANLMIIFPDQHGDAMEEMTFAQPQHTEEKSAYIALAEWIAKLKGKN